MTLIRPYCIPSGFEVRIRAVSTSDCEVKVRNRLADGKGFDNARNTCHASRHGIGRTVSLRDEPKCLRAHIYDRRACEERSAVS